MTVCVSCRLYLLQDELENLISRETEDRVRCQNFPTHREINTTDRKHALPFIIYLVDLMLNRNRKNTISANCVQKHK